MSYPKNKKARFKPTHTQRNRRVGLAIDIWDAMQEVYPGIFVPTMTQIYDQLLKPWKEIRIIRIPRSSVVYRIPKKLLVQ